MAGSEESPGQELILASELESRIHVVRGQHVILASDLAELYGVETKSLNRQVRTNQRRFPAHFAFELTKDEFDEILRCKNRTSSSAHGGQRYLPLAFTEHGILNAASVLRSDRAADMSVALVETFVAMRDRLVEIDPILARLAELEEQAAAIPELKNELEKLTSEQPELHAFIESFIDGASEIQTSLAGLQEAAKNQDKRLRKLEGNGN